MVKQTFDSNTFVGACGSGLYFVNVNGCCIVDIVSQMFRDYTTKTLLYERGVWGPASAAGANLS